MVQTDLDGDELTTTKGCFNCVKFKNCIYIEVEKTKGRDFDEILDEGYGEFRYGSGCSSYKVSTP